MAFQSIVVKKNLGAALRKAREAAGVTPSQAAGAIGRDRSTMVRIEMGKGPINGQQLAALGRLIKLAPDELFRLQELLQQVHDGDRWWDAYNTWLTPEYAELIAVENEADQLTEIHLTVVSGLLQTEAYFRALSASNPLMIDPDRTSALAEVRSYRQRRLDVNDERPLKAVIYASEASLDNQYGDDKVHREQLLAIRRMCDHPQIVYRLLRSRRMVDVSNVDLYEFGDGSVPIAFSETMLSRLPSVERDLSIRQIRRMIDTADEAALSPEESAKMIERRLDATG